MMDDAADYAGVSTRTLLRWLTHIDQLLGSHEILGEIKAQLEAELLRREKQELGGRQ